MNKKTLLLFLLVVTLLISAALPALASGFSYDDPVHGPGDLVIPKFQHNFGNHSEGCFPPLVLNSHGQCTLPGGETPPDPLPHRIGF